MTRHSPDGGVDSRQSPDAIPFFLCEETGFAMDSTSRSPANGDVVTMPHKAVVSARP